MQVKWDGHRDVDSSQSLNDDWTQAAEICLKIVKILIKSPHQTKRGKGQKCFSVLVLAFVAEFYKSFSYAAKTARPLTLKQRSHTSERKSDESELRALKIPQTSKKEKEKKTVWDLRLSYVSASKLRCSLKHNPQKNVTTRCSNKNCDWSAW